MKKVTNLKSVFGNHKPKEKNSFNDRFVYLIFLYFNIYMNKVEDVWQFIELDEI